MNGISIKQIGEGQPVLLLHGFLEHRGMWRSLAESLSSEYAFYMPNWPGHGGAPHDMAGGELLEWAKALDAVLDQMGVKQMVCVGHSMGGYVLLAAHSLNPKRFATVCLYHSSAGPDGEAKKLDRDRAANLILENKSGFIQQTIPALFAEKNRSRCRAEIEQAKGMALETSTAGAMQATLAMKNRADYRTLSRSSDRIWYLLGAEDSVLPFERMAEETAHLPSERVTWIKEAGHMSFLETPNEALASLRNYLAEASKLLKA